MEVSGKLQAKHRNQNTYISDFLTKHFTDILIILMLLVLAGAAAYFGSVLLGVMVFDGHLMSNLGLHISGVSEQPTIGAWFESDTSRYFGSMLYRDANHSRTNVHPWFSLISFFPTFAIEKFLSILTRLGILNLSDGLRSVSAVRLLMSFTASAWISSLYVLLRLIGCRRLDAILYSLLGLVSAGSVFWFVVPETYPFGSLTLLLSLIFVALSQYHQFHWFWYVGVNALSFSVTITNWMVGIFATIVNLKWWKTLGVVALSGIVMVAGAAVQKVIFPSAQLPLNELQKETEYVGSNGSGGLSAVLQSIIFHTIVMPAIKVRERVENLHWPEMLTQSSLPGSGSAWGTVAIVLWISLLSLAVWKIWRIKNNSKLRLVLGLALVSQVALHVVYGNETFLYALHFVPLLIVLVSFTSLTSIRSFCLILVCLLIGTVSINNGLQFQKAVSYFKIYGYPPNTPRLITRLAMQERPNDPWMRGTGHTVLAIPGTVEEFKSYHEPGGSFSPVVGSFGVSVWVINQQGKVQTTSDTLPLDQIQQKFLFQDNQTLPGILTDNPYYQSLWAVTAPGKWSLNLTTPTDATTHTFVVIRSVGPAGGPISSLDWQNNTLLINGRWSVKLATPPTSVYLGEEGAPNWMRATSDRTSYTSETGWGYARLELPNSHQWALTIEDAIQPPPSPLQLPQSQSTLEINLPDQQFSDSLNAQVAHLLMGLVNNQTRPGEPTNYPLPWQRDGAYTLVALVRSGQLEIAKQLATFFAEQDFFGGFGAEADAPGLSIWALEEVASRVDDSNFDRQLFPHIQRKANFILKMMSAQEEIRHPVTTPVVPSMKDNPEITLVAEPSQKGLIVGRMDGHRPLLFVNAVSYRGLLDAATLAERLNLPVEAQLWRTKAIELQQAWQAAFQPPESENDRTYISGLWHTSIATPIKEQFQAGLEKRWQQLRDPQGQFLKTPLWTYFDVSEAHQWLLLNEPQRAWMTLDWFWKHQASPGLYTWWEGNGEENSFGRWQQVRGWVHPQHVTPHYWTASEMLLLQIDMLAYLDKTSNEPMIVIGAGVSSEWLQYPMEVKGLVLPDHQVSWKWDGKQLLVQVKGKQVRVKPGVGFSANTPVQVEYIPS